jgi:erythromycin esterase-like protein
MATTTGRRTAVEAVRDAARPLLGGSGDYDDLLDRIGDARFVLLGEGSHGTHEFYKERARITRLLIEKKGFHAVAVEADWPDALRVNRFLKGTGDETAQDALQEFERFPQWMWRNFVVLDFLTDLAVWNSSVPADRRVGFYGLDLYSLYGSMAAVVDYLEKVDPEAARRARDRYGCLEFHGNDPEVAPQRYGSAVAYGVQEPCEDEVINQLTDLLRKSGEYEKRDGDGVTPADEFFFAEQNARLVVNAEHYYRAMFRGGRDETWNLRDTHMADTLDALAAHVGRQVGGPAKIAVWAHNSHLGDARATEMGTSRDELNLGQLVRERHGRESYSIGFTTYHGTVTAASDWGGRAERMRVRAGLPGSFDSLFHEARGGESFWLDLRDPSLAGALREPMLERAIGVIYRPRTERWSHYFEASLPLQFDAVLHFDETRAVEPLERNPVWEEGETPGTMETFPTGI